MVWLEMKNYKTFHSFNSSHLQVMLSKSKQRPNSIILYFKFLVQLKLSAFHCCAGQLSCIAQSPLMKASNCNSGLWQCHCLRARSTPRVLLSQLGARWITKGAILDGEAQSTVHNGQVSIFLIVLSRQINS